MTGNYDVIMTSRYYVKKDLRKSDDTKNVKPCSLFFRFFSFTLGGSDRGTGLRPTWDLGAAKIQLFFNITSKKLALSSFKRPFDTFFL